MAFPSSYVLPSNETSIKLVDVENHEMEANIMVLLRNVGLTPRLVSDLVVLEGIGTTGNRSATIILDLVEMDGRGVLLLQAFLGEQPLGSEIPGGVVAGAVSMMVQFGGVQVRRPASGREQVWIVVPMMQQDLTGDALLQALTLLADESDFLDDVVQNTWK
ncbi:MAG: hypothetical protein K1X67_13395 [Fimbriimonadaceae bacterium]|nr:hypothetical protein [Fimbriimonadaceae bacterium]